MGKVTPLKIDVNDGRLPLKDKGLDMKDFSSVAELRIKSKTKTCKIGNEIVIKDSKVLEEKKSEIQSGTIINVKNLFFNIPARRNFLKSNNVELRRIFDEFIRCALSNNKVNFILEKIICRIYYSVI